MIYIVEDDSSIRQLIAYTLKMTGFESRDFGNGEDFYKEFQQNPPELVLLDIMLPGDDGITILKKIREESNAPEVPVIMLTAKTTEYDKVLGLDSGADDYITKPFGMLELVSRIKALLRRTSTSPVKTIELQAGDITLFPEKRKVKVGETKIELTYKEFELLSMLMSSKGRVLSRNHLLESIWGYDFYGETRTIDVHIRSLRAKLGESGNLIETVRGIGYRIGAENET